MVLLKDVEKAIKEVYLIEDNGVIPIMLSTVISNKKNKNDKPVWLLLLAGSSSGKTALLQTLDQIGEWLIPVDTLTTNTFASGLARSEEVSLLHKANNGLLVFKDFTTITSMNEEGLREIMGQLRGVYDGSFNKKTGNGKDVNWVGKIGVIAGGTIAVQRKMRQFSEQGERFINYSIRQPDSIEMTRRAVNNQKDLKQKELELSKIVAEYVNGILENKEAIDLTLDEEFKEKMIQVADFATLARSPVILDKKTGKVAWVPEREMPARVAMQLTNLGSTFVIMVPEHKLLNEHKLILYKCALDSIPAERRLVLKILTKYQSASTKNIAIHLNYPTDPVASWCAQLNALKMVERVAKGDGNSDAWILKSQYRKVMSEYEQIEMLHESLTPTKDEVEKHNAQDDVQETDAGFLDKIYGGDGNTPADLEDPNFGL